MTEIEKLIEGFAQHDGPLSLLVEVLVLAAAMAFSWYVARRMRARFDAGVHHWRFGRARFAVVVGPVLSVILVWVARFALQRAHWLKAAPLLDLAITLLLVLAVIRFSVYVMRDVLPDGGFLRGSERTVTWFMWGGAALYLTGLLPEIAEALDAIALPFGKDKLSLLLVIQAAFSVAVTLAICLWLSKLLEARVLKSERLEMSTRVVMSKSLRAIAVFIALLVALPLVGIPLTALSVFGGAVGVGLGFGLQKIASNYVSGFIILLDRSIRIGDLVTVDNRQGTVQEIAARYTVIRGSDGTESIIPNETLITQSVTNHSFTDKRAVVKVVATVPFDADLDQVLSILERAGREHPHVLKDPPPSATLTKVGDPGIEVELAVWIDDVYVGLGGIRSDLLRAVLEGFRGAGIRVPAPRREWIGIATPEIPEKPS